MCAGVFRRTSLPYNRVIPEPGDPFFFFLPKRKHILLSFVFCGLHAKESKRRGDCSGDNELLANWPRVKLDLLLGVIVDLHRLWQQDVMLCSRASLIHS